jgi:hypothetical protein
MKVRKIEAIFLKVDFFWHSYFYLCCRFLKTSKHVASDVYTHIYGSLFLSNYMIKLLSSHRTSLYTRLLAFLPCLHMP